VGALVGILAATVAGLPAQAASIRARVDITGIWHGAYTLKYDPWVDAYTHASNRYRRIGIGYGDYYEEWHTLNVTMKPDRSSFFFDYMREQYGQGDSTIYHIHIDTKKNYYYLEEGLYGDTYYRGIKRSTQISVLPTVPLPFAGTMLAGGLAVLGVMAGRRERPAGPVTGR
jgi:hypothetical protein